jgi:hypothetical protein
MVIAKVAILYNKLERSSQKKLLNEMVNRVVVNPEGTVKRMELLPPFAHKTVMRVLREKQKPAQRLVNVRVYSHQVPSEYNRTYAIGKRNHRSAPAS